jgi:hypothetical protein
VTADIAWTMPTLSPMPLAFMGPPWAAGGPSVGTRLGLDGLTGSETGVAATTHRSSPAFPRLRGWTGRGAARGSARKIASWCLAVCLGRSGLDDVREHHRRAQQEHDGHSEQDQVGGAHVEG